MSAQDPYHLARRLLLGAREARFTAATRGHASTTPFALDWNGAPLVVASPGATTRIALGARHAEVGTLILDGRCASLPPDANARRRFARLHGDALEPVRLEDLRAALYRPGHPALALAPERLCAGSVFDEAAESHMVEHMNADHVDALRTYARAAGARVSAASAPAMLGLDYNGFWLRLDAEVVRVEFPAACTTSAAVRAALVAMARAGGPPTEAAAS